MAERINVVTTFSDRGYERYGHDCVDSFIKYWPENARLFVYSDSPILQRDDPKIENILLSECPSIMAFTKRFKDAKAVKGIEKRSEWSEKEKKQGYSYKFDAFKFHYSAMVPWYAAQHVNENECLFFIDGDVHTISKVSKEFLDTLLPYSKNMCIIERWKNHSETGFLGFRLPKCRCLLKKYHDIYDQDFFFTYDEWNNSFILDKIKGRALKIQDINSLNPLKTMGDVWTVSGLSKHLVHHKGKSRPEYVKQTKKSKGWA